MLTVLFLLVDGKPIRTFGSLSEVRLDAESLHAGPDGQLARFRDGVWSGFDFSAPKCVIHGMTCSCRFEGPKPEDSLSFGLVDQVDVVDGAVYLPPGHRLIAHYEERKGWYVFQARRFYAAIVMNCDADAKDR